MSSNPTCAIVVIGNEILSGNTKDDNIFYIASKLKTIGINLLEVRVIPDKKGIICDTIIALKDKYDYIFTTGGIGVTHDDITIDAVSTALNKPLELHLEAFNIFKSYYQKKGINTVPAADMKMVYLPKDAKIITPEAMPGFYIENIFVMAGSPYIMHKMFEGVIPLLKHGKQLISKSIETILTETVLAKDFEELQNKYPAIEMGSYPFIKDEKSLTSLILTSSDINALEIAYNELKEIINNLQKKY